MLIQPGERDPSRNGRLLSVLRLRGAGLQTSRHAQARHFNCETVSKDRTFEATNYLWIRNTRVADQDPN
jgi:hypothetical protein